MTDKQIIIDVCPYQGECSVSGCKRNDDGCFVRQLFEERNRAENQIVELNKKVKAKEQECERLKHDNGYEVGALERTIDNPKAENEELKRQRQADKGLITSTGKQNYQLLQEYDKLKNCLTEIKEIAMGIMDDDSEESSAYYDAKQILQKISEVGNE